MILFFLLLVAPLYVHAAEHNRASSPCTLEEIFWSEAGQPSVEVLELMGAWTQPSMVRQTVLPPALPQEGQNSPLHASQNKHQDPGAQCILQELQKVVASDTLLIEQLGAQLEQVKISHKSNPTGAVSVLQHHISQANRRLEWNMGALALARKNTKH